MNDLRFAGKSACENFRRSLIEHGGVLIGLKKTNNGNYKDDFTLDKDGVTICKTCLRMHHDGIEKSKHPAKFRYHKREI